MTKMNALPNLPDGTDLLEHIKEDFLGFDTMYKLATGETTRRRYMDSTASTLMMGIANRAAQNFLQHYANTHSEMHFSARIATDSYHWVHERILKFVQADPDEYTCFFTGSGVTAGMNRIARTLKNFRSERDIVLVSIMEHHSNDLPHRKHGGKVIHIPVDTHESQMGCIDMDLLEKYLIEHRGRVNYVSVTGISNVTGIINPINKVAKLAHKYDAFIVVDAAQLAAHVPIIMSGNEDSEMDIDALLFSGHKTYTPGSPGVVIARKSFLSGIEPVEVGGGMVDRVFPEEYFVKDQFPDREEAGTPNILGAITLGAAIHILDRIGMDNVLEEDQMLTNLALREMINMNEVVIYGETNTRTCPRAGTISFNIKEMNHGLVAAVLNDYFNIAVRNECFCAHPYVEKMLQMTHAKQIEKAKADNVISWHDEPWMGMVRVSFGIYNSMEDVKFFAEALREIILKKDKFESEYFINSKGDYEHKEFKFTSDEYFCLSSTAEREILG
ncbi:MAG: aminotransferase class V-fold PLP-dependent enzyme [Candidatus Marinimicrobia bacterium]|jgi:selenocysteine lyase/cysteine desulfurase|nr:aminotransferase class V-fold PLP-dependent enzyme [Candidatus Neomarinimicrobiota bacterium]MBT3633090.1 aminotransferase class V-fold PLP-dependent enzyme [Candidatus Neomarinimicrobiota bacterium]MBT3682309.1 aminotransferase class V-fold PLP-dependent enzyme [Candidatus Neomarinimicrobiota bacterium]MBT3758690.1 aminotransferase class V-fold PLP-dependent enzyme [Candidatus Neomarinimicrobiota bacterium]MBT3895436.1 aminotransferase class V-fold PLP-dependent enzyme [Candidatus Neomarini